MRIWIHWNHRTRNWLLLFFVYCGCVFVFFLCKWQKISFQQHRIDCIVLRSITRQRYRTRLPYFIILKNDIILGWDFLFAMIFKKNFSILYKYEIFSLIIPATWKWFLVILLRSGMLYEKNVCDLLCIDRDLDDNKRISFYDKDIFSSHWWWNMYIYHIAFA